MKKIENPLVEGLPSDVYLCAFPAPKSRYQIAREIYKIPAGQIPPTAKVSNVVRDMLSEKYGKKYLIDTPEGILSDVAPLVAEMEKELKESEAHPTKINDTERAELTAFLDDSFRSFIRNHKKKLLDEGDVSAYYLLTNIIGLIVYYKKFLLSIADMKDYEKYLSIAYTDEDIRSSSTIKQMQLSNSLIEKLQFFVPEELIKTAKITEEIMKQFVKIADYAKEKNQHAQT